jgi:hypothetical protein
VDITSFAELTRSSSGSGRLRPQLWATSDGPIDFSGAFDDTQLNLKCEFAKAEDGKYRCLPKNRMGASPSTFSDAQCTVAAFIASVDPNCPPAVPDYFFLNQKDSGSCDTLTQIFKVGAESAAGKMYSKDELGCHELPLNRQAMRLYTLGDKVDPTIFAEGTEVN